MRRAFFGRLPTTGPSALACERLHSQWRKLSDTCDQAGLGVPAPSYSSIGEDNDGPRRVVFRHMHDMNRLDTAVRLTETRSGDRNS
jgi:hypothetical protein